MMMNRCPKAATPSSDLSIWFESWDNISPVISFSSKIAAYLPRLCSLSHWPTSCGERVRRCEEVEAWEEIEGAAVEAWDGVEEGT